MQCIVNSWIRHTLAAGDAPKVRLAIAFLVGMLVWLGFLTELGHWLGTSTPLPAPDKPLEMRMVQIDLPAPTSPPAPAAPTQPSASAKSSQPARPQLRTVPQRAAQQSTAKPDLVPTQRDRPVHQPAPAPTSAQAQPATEPPTPVASAAATAPSDGNPTSHAASSGNSDARSIAQPLPALPDDLRDQTLQTVATARFAIHADGTVDVELIKPTSNPRLNQILLEALRKWRFFPAMQDGHPVESRQDIRVHFNVS